MLLKSLTIIKQRLTFVCANYMVLSWKWKLGRERGIIPTEKSVFKNLSNFSYNVKHLVPGHTDLNKPVAAGFWLSILTLVDTGTKSNQWYLLYM